MIQKYKKAIAAGVAWVGLLATDLADLSLSETEISGLVIGAIGVYGVYKATNSDPNNLTLTLDKENE